MGTSSSDISNLPEGCISEVISLTSPLDSCRSAAVCTTFRFAALSDTVWGRFLPPDYPSILSRAVDLVEYASKKELFFRLCESIIIDDGKMSFSLDKSSGAKCFMLSARQLLITWGDIAQYWTWHPLPDSRFSEVARLVDVCWLDIRGKIESRELTPKTTYAVYFIFKLDEYSRGLGHPNQETMVKLGAQVSKHMVKVQSIVHDRPRIGIRPRPRSYIRVRNAMPEENADAEENNIVPRDPQARADGWMEMEMGTFYNDDGKDGEVEMSLMEVKGGKWKSGLIIQGIEIRPKK